MIREVSRLFIIFSVLHNPVPPPRRGMTVRSVHVLHPPLPPVVGGPRHVQRGPAEQSHRHQQRDERRGHGEIWPAGRPVSDWGLNSGAPDRAESWSTPEGCLLCASGQSNCPIRILIILITPQYSLSHLAGFRSFCCPEPKINWWVVI